MQFPTGIDETDYAYGGENCADGLSSESKKSFRFNCYNVIRPVATMGYFAIPKLLGSNPVSQSYILLAMNGLLVLLSAYALKVALYPYASSTSAVGIPRAYLPMYRAASFAAAGAVFLVLFNSVVGAMSDLPSLAFFIMGTAACIKTLSKPLLERARWFFAAGCFMAMAALLKPNYFFYGPVVLGLALAIDFNEGYTAKLSAAKLLINPLCAGLGLSFALIQCFWIYAHTGKFWPYDASQFVGVKTPHQWPFVGHGVINKDRTRLFDGLDPVPVSNLVLPLDAVSHMLVKLYVGIFPQKLEPYSVFEYVYPPARWYPSKLELVGMLLASGAYLTYTAMASLFGPKPVRFLSAVGLMYAVFTMAISHTEYRYYLAPRLILATTLLYYVSYFVLSWRAKNQRADWLSPLRLKTQ